MRTVLRGDYLQLSKYKVKKEDYLFMDFGMCSVIIPVYNVKEYLEDCLKSILEQTYINYEIILVDDGSTDGSAEICDNYSKNYKNIKVIHQNNFGVSRARNVGLVNTSGKYILFVDPDDIVKKDFIDKLIRSLLENSTDIACCQYYRFNDTEIFKNPKLKWGGESRIYNGIDAFKIMLKEDLFTSSVWNKIYRREIIFQEDHIFHSFEEGLTVGEDEKWLMKLLDNVKISVFFFNDELYGWRKRKNSALNSFCGLTIQNLDNIKTQEEVLQMALELDDSEFEYIARVKLFKETFNICKECYKINDIVDLKKVYPLLKKGRHAVYLQKPNRRIFKMLIWELLFIVKIRTYKVV